MTTYIALELLYNKDLIEQPDPETGVMRLVERGYIEPGQAIDLDDARAEILLAVGAIVLPPAPDAAPEPIPDAESPARPRRR